jgi:hypothetical protein
MKEALEVSGTERTRKGVKRIRKADECEQQAIEVGKAVCSAHERPPGRGPRASKEGRKGSAWRPD